MAIEFKKIQESSDGERIGARADHGFSGGDAVQLSVSSVSNNPSVDTVPKPKFDRNEYQKIYMREWRKKQKGKTA